MRSRTSEKYSNSTWFPLFCSLLICLGNPAFAEEVLWSHSGLGANPNLSVLLDGSKPTLVLVGSPFQGGVLALDPSDGHVRWKTVLTERLSRPARMLADVALFSTHTGTLLAIDTSDGDELWRQASANPQDYTAVSPMVVEGSVYTLSEDGVLEQFSTLGERIATRRIDMAWEGRRAEFVPMWRDATGLTFLDQAGRLRSFDLSTLAMIEERRVTTAVGPGGGQLGSEILGGIYSAAQGLLWTTELSGLLRLSEVESGATRWTVPFATADDMYSEDGRALSIPILSLPPERKCLVLTKRQALVFSVEDGRLAHRYDLPSQAVAPALFDLNRRTWWVLTSDSLVAIGWGGEIRSYPLPLLEEPYSAALAGPLLIVGAADGRIYAITLPDPTSEEAAGEQAVHGEPMLAPTF